MQNIIVILIIALILFLSIKAIINNKHKGGCCGCSQSQSKCNTNCSKYK